MRRAHEHVWGWLRGQMLMGALLACCATAIASDYRGLVTFNGLPVPGATVTVTQNGKKFTAVSDVQGFFAIASLADGALQVDVEMTGFAHLTRQVTLAPDSPLDHAALAMLSPEELRAELKPVPGAPITEAQARIEPKVTGKAAKPASGDAAAAGPAPATEETAQKASEGLLINGSVNNAATSQFSLAARFGNTASGKSLYQFMVNARIDNSVLDARSYSITGFNSPKPQTSQLTGGFAVQGPLKIPGLLRNGPNLFVGYQRTQSGVATTTPGLVPTVAERQGDLSADRSAAGQPLVIYNPATGQPYADNQVPVSAQAKALLALYPLPNLEGNSAYNFQVPLIADTHEDALNSNINKTVGRRNQFSGTFAATSTRSSNTSLMGFVDATRMLGVVATTNWSHTFNMHWRANAGYQFSRLSTRVEPYWQNRENVSGDAGIHGNDQEAAYWGPPTLNFSNGITALTDAQSSFIRDMTNGVSAVVRLNELAHNITAGVEFRRQQFNYLTQANPRGSFTFTGAATSQNASSTTSSTGTTGSAMADFLIGTPDASAIAYGNADKYLRQSVMALYATDDWRVSPQLTLNLGVRWEYGAPVTERKQRLVNLDVASGFTAIAPVLASAPKGSLTGLDYPDSLMRADRRGIEPRLGMSWRPLPASSLMVSLGYGMYYDTSVYQGIALLMAQQAPLSTSLTLENSAACPLSLAYGFLPCSTTTPETFGVDPDFRVGHLHIWSLKVQRDLPGSMQMVATYLGNYGANGVQEFLPNTYAPGAANPCASCPSGFEYLTSTGSSTRESGQLQLRRRLKSGFTASVLYTYSKSMDDDSALGGKGAATLSSARLAQDWRNLSGERGLSSFDQRHLLNATVQYTTGMGMHGGALLSGWRGRLYKEWTIQTQITAGSGLPETPIVSAATIAGYNAVLRPDVTGAAINVAADGRFRNPAAFVAPSSGQWGNARRNSIIGPSQFTLDAAMLRTFRLPEKMTLDLQVAAQNALNHVTYTTWVTNINSTQFGLPALANPMRTVQTSLRLRF